MPKSSNSERLEKIYVLFVRLMVQTYPLLCIIKNTIK